jgi:hypothetical protein
MENDADLDEEIAVQQRRRRNFGVFGIMMSVQLFLASLAPNERQAYLSPSGGPDYDHLFSDDCHPRKFHNHFRMKRDTFHDLYEVLVPHMERSEMRTSFRDRIAMVINYLAHPDSQSGLYNTFNHGPEWISKTIHEVIEAILAALEFAPPSDPRQVSQDPIFAFFEGCIGAIDGTHIPVALPFGGEAGWRNRKGEVTQNVFVCVNFDLMVTHVDAGCEGSGHDSTVFREACVKGGFSVPEDCFILADAGYGLTSSVLVPFRRTVSLINLLLIIAYSV